MPTNPASVCHSVSLSLGHFYELMLVFDYFIVNKVIEKPNQLFVGIILTRKTPLGY